MLQHLHGSQVHPLPVVEGEAQVEPIGQVDRALVLHGATADLVDQSVEETRRVRAGMVNVVRDRFGCCTAGGETPVAEGAERFAAALVRRVPPVELEGPGVAHRRPSLVQSL